MDVAFLNATRLWDELADSEIAGVEASRLQIMAGLCGLLRAHNAGWVAAVRAAVDRDDALHGWRIGALSYLHADSVNEETVREIRARWERREVDEFNRLGLARAGTFQVFTMRGEMTREWFEGDYYRLFYASRGIFDALCVSAPVTADAESFLIFHRSESAGVFADPEIDLATYALRGRTSMHRSWMLERGLLIASKPLSPTERRVLDYLLSGDVEKVIAKKLALSPATAHDHVKSIYRKFGVGNRARLMSLWLNRPGPDTKRDGAPDPPH